MPAFRYFCLVLLFILPINSWSAIEINLSRSQLALLAQHLKYAPDDQKFDFARIALSQLYETYEKELTHSLNERPFKQKKKIKLNRWRNATNDYLKQIDESISHILIGGNYDFYINDQDKILFSISGNTIMLSGLNYKTDQLMESNIINEFCNLYDCQHYLSESEEIYFKNTQPIITGHWLMNKRHKADFDTNNGIIFRFDNLDNRKLKENWAIHITQDLLFLVKTLELTQAKGFKIDFSSVTISSLSTHDGIVKLTVNKQGDFIYTLLPAFSKASEFFQRVKPWLQQFQLNNLEKDFAIIIKSEHYFNEIS